MTTRLRLLQSQTMRLQWMHDPIRAERIKRVRLLADAVYGTLDADDPVTWREIIRSVNNADAAIIAAELAIHARESY